MTRVGRWALVPLLGLMLPACAGDDLSGLSAEELLGRLGSPEFTVRDAAFRELERRGRSVYVEILQTAQSTDDPETRFRTIELLRRLGYFDLRRLIALRFYLLEDLGLDLADAVDEQEPGDGRAALALEVIGRVRNLVDDLELLRELRLETDPERQRDLERLIAALGELLGTLELIRQELALGRPVPDFLADRLPPLPDLIQRLVEKEIERVGGGDLDGDGTSNLDELRLGQDPLRPGPF